MYRGVQNNISATQTALSHGGLAAGRRKFEQATSSSDESGSAKESEEPEQKETHLTQSIQMNYVGDLREHPKESVTVAASRTLVHKKRRFASSSSSDEGTANFAPQAQQNATLVNRRKLLMSSSSSDGENKNSPKLRNKSIHMEDQVARTEHKSAPKPKKVTKSVSIEPRKTSKLQSRKTTKRISSGSEKSDFSRSASVLNATQKRQSIRIAHQESKKSLKSNKSSKRRGDRRRDDSGSRIDFQEKQEDDVGLRSYSPSRNQDHLENLSKKQNSGDSNLMNVETLKAVNKSRSSQYEFNRDDIGISQIDGNDNFDAINDSKLFEKMDGFKSFKMRPAIKEDEEEALDETQYVEDLTEVIDDELDSKMESLHKSTHIHKVYHQIKEDQNKNSYFDKEDSVGLISSADERDCMLVFSGQFQFRFQAINKIEKEQLKMKKIRDKKIETLKQYNSKCSKFKRLIFCTKMNIPHIKKNKQCRDAATSQQISQMQQSLMGSVNRMQVSGKFPGANKTTVESKLTKLKQSEGAKSQDLGEQIDQPSGRQNNDSEPSGDHERGEEDEDHFDGSDDNQDPLHMSDIMQYDEEDQEVKQNCFTRFNQRMKKYMIDPNNARLRQFHIFTAVTLYVDIFMTSLLIGNYRFQIRDPDYAQFLNHEEVYLIMLAIQGLDIVLNFFKIQMVDVQILNTPKDIASNYFNSHFLTDIISVYPYNFDYPAFLILRFCKLRRLSQCQQYLEKFISDALSDYIDNELLKKLIDTFSMIVILFLISHFFACIWMLIGYKEMVRDDAGWISSQIENNRQTTDVLSLYVSSVYWVIASFSSVGYGDITPKTESEMIYALLIEMLGICVFGYMIGTIQTLFTSFKIKDQNQDLIDSINLWLILVDKAKPSHLLFKKVFDDVRDFYTKKLKHEAQLEDFDKYLFFEKLKPRLQKSVLDSINKLKYELFEDLFEDCSTDFQREIIFNCKYQYFNAKQEEDQCSEFFNELELPVIQEAFQYSQCISLIISGSVHIMDQAGMYDYGIIKSGSYFGDVSLLLNKPEQFSFFYNPNQEKPLQMLTISAEIFTQIMRKHPLEHEIWLKRALVRQEMFDNYKSLTLLKYMKTIIKNPLLIIQNRNISDHRLSLLQRVSALKDKEFKLKLFHLYLRQYDIQRQIKMTIEKQNKKTRRSGKRSKSTKGHEHGDQSFGDMANDAFDLSFKNQKAKEGKAMQEPSISDIELVQDKTLNITIGQTQLDFQSNSKTPGFDPNKVKEIELESINQEGMDSTRKLMGTQHEGGQAELEGGQPELSEALDDLPPQEGRNPKRQGKLANTSTRERIQKQKTEAGGLFGEQTPSQIRQLESSYGEGSMMSPKTLQSNNDSLIFKPMVKPPQGVQNNLADTRQQMPNRHTKTFLDRNITKKNLSRCDLKLLQQMYAETQHDLMVMMDEYFYQKKKKIKKQQNMKNSLLKATNMMKQHNHKTLPSKSIHHMDMIIEEYCNFDVINDQIMLDDIDPIERVVRNERQFEQQQQDMLKKTGVKYDLPTKFDQSQYLGGLTNEQMMEKNRQFSINSKNVRDLAYNDYRLNCTMQNALTQDTKLNEEFNLIKMHQIHYLKLQIEECQVAQDEKSEFLKSKIENLSNLKNKEEQDLCFIDLFESLSLEKQDEILDKIYSKKKYKSLMIHGAKHDVTGQNWKEEGFDGRQY